MPKPATGLIDANANMLSVSQLNLLFQCEVKWMLRYVMKVKPKTTAEYFAVGRAVDYAADRYNQRIIDGGARLTQAETVALALAEFDRIKDDVAEWISGPMAARHDVRFLTLELHDRSLSQSIPVSSQRKVLIPLGGGWVFIGYLDVEVATSGTSGKQRLDYKTASKPWPKDKEVTDLQALIYSLEEMDKDTVFRWHIVDRETFKLDERVRKVSAKEKKAFMAITVPKVLNRVTEIRRDTQRAVPSGYGGGLCTKTYCNVWRECQKIHGLPIKD